MTKPTTSNQSFTRRDFLKSTAAITTMVAVSPLIIPSSVRAAGSDTLKVGLIGCGGRGTGAAGQALAADKGAVLTAMADAVEDRLKSSLNSIKKAAGEKFSANQIQVDPDHCFTGLDSYKKVIDSGVDVVLLTSAPGFRPMHIEYAVNAGKHVFAEKPMATDAPGVRSVAKSVELAKAKKIALVAGFNGRYTFSTQAQVQKIHDGAIGAVVAMYTCYNTGYLWNHGRKPEWSDMEWQVRNWYYFTWAGGDHLVEQAVHNCDKFAWVMHDVMPARAMALGGRQVRIEMQWGNIYDHFAVLYEWPNGTRGFLFCRQQDNCANDVSDHIMGTKGNADFGGPRSGITGADPWRYSGPVNSGHEHEHVEMFASIRKGEPINNGDRMVNSTMIAILGRMAAYTGKVITWEQAMSSQENLLPEKLEWGPIATPPVAMPGKTKFF